MKESMELTDLFKVASLLCVGASLKGLKVVDRTTALFEIEAYEIKQLEKQYSVGAVYLNPLELKEKLNLLKDIMFAKLREQETTKTFVR
jgi:hypothetical protein